MSGYLLRITVPTDIPYTRFGYLAKGDYLIRLYGRELRDRLVSLHGIHAGKGRELKRSV